MSDEESLRNAPLALRAQKQAVMKSKTDSEIASAAQPRRGRARSLLRGALWGLLLAAFGAAGVIWTVWPAVFSIASSEALAIVRERRSIRAGEDVASAIELVAGEMLSPAALMSALHKTADAKATDEMLAAAAEELRGRLRVDVDPGAGKQPWTISIRSTSSKDAPLINVLAEEYCRARQAAVVAEQQAAYRAAQAASESARRSADQSQQELDRELERLAEQVDALSQRRAAPEVAKTQSGSAMPEAGEPSPRRRELQGQIAELETQRAMLLEKLLPAHPEVQEVDSELEAARAQLEKLAGESPPAGPQADPSLPPKEDETDRILADLAARRESHAQAWARAAQLVAAERQASEQALRRRQDEIVSLTPAPLSAPATARPSWQALAPAGVLALLAVLALGRQRAASPDVFCDADELEASLGVPLVGMLAG